MSNPATKTSDTVSRATKMNADISALIRSRHTLLWVTTREEKRVERALIEAAGTAKYKTRLWDCAAGISDPEGKQLDPIQDPLAALNSIMAAKDPDGNRRFSYIMRDLHKWWDPTVLRTLRNLAKALQGLDAKDSKVIIILTPSAEVPPELAGHVTVIDYPLPDRLEMEKIMDSAISSVPADIRATALDAGMREQAIDAAVGLTAEEAGNCYAKSLVTTHKVDPAIISNEKKRIIAREKVLTWYDPDPRGLDSIGGLDVLKKWLEERKVAFTSRARAYGLPTPKGVLLAGVPGVGKSLTAKCIASVWKMPLLRLDLGALKGKFVGESEANIRKALQVAESVSPCILWADELEKALKGATGPQGDGGVSSDALGTLLSWMQDREGAAFVIATVNDVDSLPPELLRKGRFDEIFWVDLPTTEEREQILKAVVGNYKAGTFKGINYGAVARQTDRFTGAELADIIPGAMFVAFAEGERQVTTEDLLRASESIIPLAKTAEEKIDAMRKWAKGRARQASTPEEVVVNKARQLDMD